MKRILATSTILAMSAGFASAEVTLSGDARMGIISSFDDAETAFTSRARVSFTLAGESDSGFSFGASFRADNAGDAASGTAGEVYISGAFGKLSMGDIDNGAQAAVGQVSGVGLTGLGDLNEIVYLGDASPAARYDFTSGGLTFSASAGNTGDEYAVGVAYAMEGYKFSVGYESGYKGFWGNEIYEGNDVSWNYWEIEDHLVIGADATFGAVTVKARYGKGDGFETYAGSWGADLTQYALSATYTADALSLTGFVASSNLESSANYFDNTDRYGIGASYDLGGGAAVKAGYAKVDYEGFYWNAGDTSYAYSDSVFDLGLSFSF